MYVNFTCMSFGYFKSQFSVKFNWLVQVLLIFPNFAFSDLTCIFSNLVFSRLTYSVLILLLAFCTSYGLFLFVILTFWFLIFSMPWVVAFEILVVLCTRTQNRYIFIHYENLRYWLFRRFDTRMYFSLRYLSDWFSRYPRYLLSSILICFCRLDFVIICPLNLFFARTFVFWRERMCYRCISTFRTLTVPVLRYLEEPQL